MKRRGRLSSNNMRDFPKNAKFGAKTILDPDLLNFRNRVLASGGTISLASFQAVTEFVKGCKIDNTWHLLLDVGLFVGDNLTAALTKLKHNPQVPSAFTSYNFTDSNYSEATGLNPAPNNNKYLDTGFIPSQQIVSSLSSHISFLNLTDTFTSGTEVGSQSESSRFLMHLNYSGVAYFDSYGTGNGRISHTNPSSAGFYIGSRISATNFALYKNGSVLVEGSTSEGQLPTASLSLFGLSNGSSVDVLSNNVCGFYSSGEGLNNIKATLLNNRVQALQLALKRGS